jgi:hypothetical protein
MEQLEACRKGDKMIDYEKLYHMLIVRRREIGSATAEYQMLTAMIDAVARYLKETK